MKIKSFDILEQNGYTLFHTQPRTYYRKYTTHIWFCLVFDRGKHLGDTFILGDHDNLVEIEFQNEIKRLSDLEKEDD